MHSELHAKKSNTVCDIYNKATLEIVLKENTIFHFLFIVVSFYLFFSNILIYYKV